MTDLSYTTVSSWLACPSRVMYKLQGVKTSKTGALVYGSAFHEILSKSFKGQKPNVQSIVESYFKGVKKDDDDWNGIVKMGERDWPVDVMSSWMEEAVGLILAHPTRPQSTELTITKKFPNFTLKGVIDAFWDGYVVDFKLAGKFYKTDPLQAACYSLLSGGPTKFKFIVVYKEKIPRLEVIDVPQAQDPYYLNWVIDRVLTPVAKAIESGNFPANPTYQFCTNEWCPYWTPCRGK
mgnify:CR=1 FL=1